MRKGLFKGLVSLALVLVMILSISIPANAAETVKLSKSKATLEAAA